MRILNLALSLVFVFTISVSLSSAQVSETADLKSPFISDDFIKASQNIPQNDNNNLDEIYFRVLTLHAIDPYLGMLSQEEKGNLTRIVQSFQNPNGGFGDWVKDRSMVGSTRSALEVLDILGEEPLNRTSLIAFIYRLQIINISYGNFGFKSYLKDRDSDLSATYNAIKSLKLLGAAIPNEQGVIEYLRNHQNFDGGFGYQTNRKQEIFWISTSLHTYRGLEALRLMGEEPEFMQEATEFLQSLQTGEGGFSKNKLSSIGSTSDTFDAIMALKSLEAESLRPGDSIIFLRNNQKGDGGFVENAFDTKEGPHSTYWGIAALKELGETLTGNLAQKFIMEYSKSENDGGFGNRPGSGSNIRFTFDAVFALNLIGKEPLDRDIVINYIIDQRNPDGGYGVNGISSTESTYRCVYSLMLLGFPVPDREETISYLKSSQNLDGGFGWSRNSVSRGSHTFRSIKALALLGSEPANIEKVIHFVQNLQNKDGGFGNFIGDDSDLGSTYRALAALDMLGSLPLDVEGVSGFIRDSQNPDGGFKRSPVNRLPPENFSMAIYTYDAVRSMDILEMTPENRTSIYNFIISLRNPDFGYGQQSFYTSDVSNTFTSLLSYFTLFPDNLNTAPRLTNIKVTPENGDASSLFTFTVAYSDVQKQMPEYVYVLINDDKNVMIPTGNADNDVLMGKDYKFETSLPVGNNTYYFEASDGLETVRTDDFSMDVERIGNPPSLNIGNYPETGDEETEFVFTAVYKDPDNDSPAFVNIKIDDDWFGMLPSDKGSNFTQGKEYYYRTKLQEGLHRFRAMASDGANRVLTPYSYSPAVSVDNGIIPDAAVLEKIRELILSEFGANLSGENVKDSVYLGQFAWEVDVNGNPIFVSRDGTRILEDTGFPVTTVSIIIAIVITVLLLAIKRRRG